MDKWKSAEELLQSAESAGFELQLKSGFAIATPPASPDVVTAEAMLQDLAANVGEIRRLLYGRADRARRQRFRGLLAFSFAWLQAGVVEDCEPDGRLTLKCRTSWGTELNSTFAGSEVVLISTAGASPADRRGAGIRGDKLGHLMRQAERLGARLWSEDAFVIFGWPTQDLAIVPGLIADAIREAAEWADRQSPNIAIAAEAISDKFVEYACESSAFTMLGFGRRAAAQRELAARFLQLAKHVHELHAALHAADSALDNGGPKDPLSGSRAILASGEVVAVSIEGEEGGALICSDEIGRWRRCLPASLLVIVPRAHEAPIESSDESSAPPRRWSIFGGGKSASIAS